MEYVLFCGFKIGFLALKTIIENGTNLRLVIVEKEHGHELEKFYDAIVELCEEKGISYLDSKQSVAYEEKLSLIKPDYLLILGYRRLIPDSVMRLTQRASVACHFSMLPEYRGFAPVNWAVINGETQSGITFFHIEDEVDSGDIVAQQPFQIEKEEDVNAVFDKCHHIFTQMLPMVLKDFERGHINRIHQDHKRATYTCSRSPEDGLIDWNDSSENIYNLVRGLAYPFPGAFTYFDRQELRIWSAEPFPIPKYVGVVTGKVIRVIPDIGVVVLAKEGAILVKEVQLQGGERRTADQIIKSVRVRLGGI